MLWTKSIRWRGEGNRPSGQLRPLRARLRAQLAPQDLPRDGLRELVDDLDLARVLVRRHPLLAEGDDLLLVGRLARVQADERLDGLAAVLVRHPHHRRLLDGGMTVQAVLDPAG